MKEQQIYLDHAATTSVRPEVLEAMLPYFTVAYGNPSSVYSAAGAPREAVDQAREMVASVLGSKPGEIIFTGGGTEADNLAVLGAARALRERGDHVVTSAIEHDAVLHSCRQLEREGFRVTYLPVDRSGVVHPDALRDAIDERTTLVSIMLANNEIGTVEPIRELAEIAHSRGALVHTDAVQAAGALDLSIAGLGVDLLSISAHKIYGPKGVGALYARRGTMLQPLVHGGEQERGRRAGTENVPGIVGLAVALVLAERERVAETARLTSLRDRLIDGVLGTTAGIHLSGHPTQRLPGHASFYLEHVSGESVLVNLDVRGILCSAGSACKAGSTDPSSVLLALGLSPAMARNGIRMTLGRENTDADVDRVIELFPQVVDEVRPGMPAGV